MNKITALISVVTLIVMTSCGGHDVCTCASLGIEITSEMEKAGTDAEKLKGIQEKYQEEMKICDEIISKWRDEIKDLSPEALEKKQAELNENCPALKEIMENE